MSYVIRVNLALENESGFAIKTNSICDAKFIRQRHCVRTSTFSCWTIQIFSAILMLTPTRASLCCSCYSGPTENMGTVRLSINMSALFASREGILHKPNSIVPTWFQNVPLGMTAWFIQVIHGQSDWRRYLRSNWRLRSRAGGTLLGQLSTPLLFWKKQKQNQNKFFWNIMWFWGAVSNYKIFILSCK